MTESELITSYNYDSFVPEKFERWIRITQEGFSK